MAVTLDKEVRVVRDVQGEVFYDGKLPVALKAAQKYAADNGTSVANMPLLLRQFPHSEWYTANSEDHSGVDKHGAFGPKDGHIVVTLHGGKEGIGLLTPEVIEKAYDMKKRNKGGMNELYAAKHSDVFDGKDVLTNLLQGGMPDGTKILIIPYSQLVNEGSPGGSQRYAVVRSLELARKTDSGYKGIDRLADGEGNVKDSQVIAYAGGAQEGQDVINRAKESFKSGKLGVWHPFNHDKFNPDESQGRVLFLVSNDYDGLIGYDNLGDDGRSVGVAPEAQREKSLVAPTLEQVLAIVNTSPSIAPANRDALVKQFAKLYE